MIWTDDIFAKHSDASLFDKDESFEADIVIIGSGAGGGSIAEIFAEKGLSVILVEEGPLKTRKDFKMNEAETYPNLYQESAARTTDDKAIRVYQGRSVGGSTTINWTSSFRTPQTTLEHWRKNYSIKGISDKELDPWFEKVEERFNISDWIMPPNLNNENVKKGAQKLGWSFGVMRRNTKNCINSGYCGLGCPVDAKQSTLITSIPSALKKNTRLISRVRAEYFLSKNGKVTGLVARAMNSFGSLPTEKKVMIKAKQFVLSGGAIGSPAVLLRSAQRDKAFNPYNNVGKRTFLHPVTIAVALMPFKVNGEYGAPQSIYSDHFLDSRGDRVGYKLEVGPMQPAFFATLIEGHGDEHTTLMRKRPEMSNIIALMKDGFDPRSVGGEVYLGKYELPKLKYEITPYLWEGFKDALLNMGEALFAAGAKDVAPVHRNLIKSGSFTEYKKNLSRLRFEKQHLTLVSAHVMGGCMFGEDEKSCVVDSNGRHHEFENLHVIDGSIFPTSIGANPMQSIFGFSAKLASSLAAKI